MGANEPRLWVLVKHPCVLPYAADTRVQSDSVANDVPRAAPVVDTDAAHVAEMHRSDAVARLRLLLPPESAAMPASPAHVDRSLWQVRSGRHLLMADTHPKDSPDEIPNRDGG